MMVETPELDKASKIVGESQRIGEFIDWVKDTKHIWLCQYITCTEVREHIFKPGTYYEVEVTELVPIKISTESLLAEFFDINLDKIEAEKRALLEQVRCGAEMT